MKNFLELKLGTMTMEGYEKQLLHLFRHLSEKNRGACKLSWVC
jgi:hypothetical protein